MHPNDAPGNTFAAALFFAALMVVPTLPVPADASGPFITAASDDPVIQLPSIQLFWHGFEDCYGPVTECQTARTDVPYAYTDGPATSEAWYVTSAGSFVAPGARSGEIGSNEHSRLDLTVTVPQAYPSAGVYALSFSYKVDAGSGERLQVRVLQTIEFAIGPDLVLEHQREVVCFPGDGVGDTGGWRTFNAANAPTSPCTSLPPGEHTFSFTYEKDGSGTSHPDAAFIDNLEISLVPV